MAPFSPSEPTVDAVTQANLVALGQAPAMALASAYQTLAHAAAMAALNAVQAQQQAFVAHQAVTDQSVALLLGMIHRKG